MNGRRIQVEEGVYFPGDLLNQPGDYYGPVQNPGYYDGRPGVWFLLPNCNDESISEAVKGPRLVCSPPHVFTEEPDGTLTIRESILAKGWQGEPDLWHGYLTKGVWKEC
jgi:hypothetical protein